MKDHIKRFIEDPSQENFLQLRAVIISSPAYSPYSTDYNETTGQLMAQEQYNEVVDYLMSLMDNWFLNPGIHIMLAFVQHKSGRENEARFEHSIATHIFNGILSTGDGSEANPYLVLRTADEYDLMIHLGKKSTQQALITKGEKHFDRHDCMDGSELWFDVTTQLEHMKRNFRNHQESGNTS